MLAVLPGDAQPDPDLTRRSTLAPHHCERLRQYLVTGGSANARPSSPIASICLHGTPAPEPAAELPKAGVYRDTSRDGTPLAAITFYRSVLEGAQTAPIDALIDALQERGIGTKAFYVASLKDSASIDVLSAGLQVRSPM